MPIAPLVESYRRWAGGAWPSTVPAGTPAAPPFPQSPLDLNVAIFVDSSWIDITPSVYGGGRANIVITRGKQNEAGKVEPSTAAFELNNRDGQFSPRNPTSWLYGKIGRNTLVRIAIGGDVRFMGEISEWPRRWDTTGRDVFVPIQAAGILRRLGQGASPLKSTLYRGFTRLAHPPKAYWPCEDAEKSTTIASGLGGPAMTIGLATPTFATFTRFACSEALPTIQNSQWVGNVPTYTSTGNVQVWWLQHIPTGAATVDQAIVTLHDTGTAATWRLEYAAADGGLRLRAFDSNGTSLLDSGVMGFFVNNKLLRVGIQLIQNGANIDWSIDTLEVGLGKPAVGTGATLAGRTVGQCTQVVVNNAGGLGNDIAFGHIAVHDEILDLFELAGELNAHEGEGTVFRIQRLCAEEGIDFRPVGGLTSFIGMGPQLPGDLLTLLRECEDANGGILYEPRDTFGLEFRNRPSMYDQQPRLALDYATADLSGIEPVDDDQATRNDITVNRTGGSSARAVKQTGPLSILPPPAGVGRYDESVTMNLQADSQLADAAGWLLFLGTVDEARYPQISLDLARQRFAGNATLAETARALDVGDRLTVTNPPAWLPPDQITQLALGFTETLGNFTHQISINCAPETPWGQVARYDDDASRYSSDGSSLAAGVDATATSLSVATPSGPLWAHNDGDFDIKVGGEVMTVTAVSGATSPQTFTVTRSINGVVKAHSASEELVLAHPVVYAR